MTEKKSNFLPLLLIGGGLAGAALLYSVGTKQSKEDYSLGGAVGVGGSGDFLGSSGISKGYDSTDLGIEDFAYNRANPDAFALPSDGAANPENVVDDVGEWPFVDTAALGLTAAAVAPTVAKAVKSAGSKVAGSAAGQAVKSAGSAVAGKAAGVTAGKVAQTAVKGAGVLGVLGLVDTFFEVTGVKNAFFSETGLTGNLQGVNTSFSTAKSTVTTDTATKEGVGNMVYDNRQLKIASGLASTGSTYETITAEETNIVNKALGTTGDVIKQSYGTSGYSYIAAGGKQLSFAGTDLKTAASKVTSTKKTVPSTSKSSSKSNSGSATTASLSKLFGGK